MVSNSVNLRTTYVVYCWTSWVSSNKIEIIRLLGGLFLFANKYVEISAHYLTFTNVLLFYLSFANHGAVSMGNGLIANSWTVGLLERKGICMLILIN
jgi:hypothetical protein